MAEPAQQGREYHCAASRSCATTGSAVVTAKDSKAMNVISPNTPITSDRVPGAQSFVECQGEPTPEVTLSRR